MELVIFFEIIKWTIPNLQYWNVCFFLQNFAEFSFTGICKCNTNLLNALANSSQWGLCVFFSLPEKSSVENNNCFQCRAEKKKSALQAAVLKWPDNLREISTRVLQRRSWMTWRSLRSCTQLQADRAWGPLQPPSCSLQLGTAAPQLPAALLPPGKPKPPPWQLDSGCTAQRWSQAGPSPLGTDA